MCGNAVILILSHVKSYILACAVITPSTTLSDICVVNFLHKNSVELPITNSMCMHI